MKNILRRRGGVAGRLGPALRRRVVLAWAIIAAFVVALAGTTSPVSASGVDLAMLRSSHATAAVLTSKTASAAAPATVGALFEQGQTTAHACTASVLDTPTGDLVLTAAHCVRGTGAGMTFAPGYSNGTTPYGVWTVTAAYAPSGWLAAGSQSDDMAVLRIAPKIVDGHSRSIESVVGGEAIGSTPTSGTIVDPVGYAAGAGGSALTCATTTATTTSGGVGYPSFTCGSYPTGTSGGPWLSVVGGKTQVVGLIGGLYQGGCSNEQSFSPPLDDLRALVASAASSSGETLPSPPASGC